MTSTTRPLNEQQQDLARRYVPFARSIAGPFAKARPQERDEIESAAYLGLTRAAGNYDLSRGVKFATYAKNRIRGEILDTLRNLVPRGFRRSGDQPRLVRFSPDLENTGHAVAYLGLMHVIQPDELVMKREELEVYLVRTRCKPARAEKLRDSLELYLRKPQRPTPTMHTRDETPE